MKKIFYDLRTFSFFGVIFPWLFLFIFIVLFNVDMPRVDQWSLVPIIERTLHGDLPFMDLWEQRNGHYQIVPLTIIVALAYVTNWNIFYEALMSFFVSSAIFLLLSVMVSSYKELKDNKKLYYLLPIISLIIFSLNQWENWFLGWQVCIFLNVFLVILGFVILSRASIGWLPFFTAAVSGIIATLSFANGLLFWIIALLLIFLLPMESKSKKIGKLLFWVAISSLVYYIYLSDFSQQSGEQSKLLFVINNPVKYLNYVFIYLGAPLFSYAWGVPFGHSIAFCTGLIGTILFCCFCLGSLYKRNLVRCDSLLFQAIGLYAIGSAFLTGFARADYGCMQALSSRYISISLLLWISNMVFLFQCMSYKNDSIGFLKFFSKKNAVALITIFLVMIFFDSVYGSIMAVKKHKEFLLIRNSILVPSDSDEVKRLRKIYGPYTEKDVEILKKNNLSLFRISHD